jgi:choline-sulfatase
MASQRPNVLFLLSDEHSFRFMGHCPEERGGEPALTPTFDRLAAGGTVFTDAYCQMPLCTPSRLCILTGQEVREAGAWTNESVLRPELTTLPETFANAGYTTCLVGKMHLGGSRQFVGFQHRPYGDLTGKCGHQWEPITDDNRQGMRVRTSHAGVTGIPESQIQDHIVCHESVAWLREHKAANPDAPWFLCASFSRPHFPLTAPRRWIDHYATRTTEPKVPASGDAFDHPMSAGMRQGFKADDISHDEMMRARTAYFACVSYLDEVIGDLMLRLDADGLLDNTIIVYTTDHGEMAGEHGVWWKNGWYEACTRVPLIVSLPEQRNGQIPAREVPTPVALVDLFPTLCGLAGHDAPDGLAGRSLAAAARDGAALEDRPVFTDALQPRWSAGTEFRSIRWKTWKYVVFRDAPPLFFDLASDPGEQVDLIDAPLEGDALAAREYLAGVAAESIDFAAAECERKERDGGLRQTYAQNLPPSTGNLYLMPDGRLLNGDDLLYHPTVIAERPEDAFTG